MRKHAGGKHRGSLGKLKQEVKVLMKQNAVEIRKVDVSYSVNPLLGTPTIQTFTPLAAGVDETQRDGNHIAVKSLSMKGYVVANAASTENAIRVMVFKWKPDGVADGPTLAKMFTSVTNITSSSNSDRRRDYIIYYDKIHCFIKGQNQSTFEFYKKIQPRDEDVAYSGVNAGDLAEGQFYILYWPDNGGNAPTCVFTLGCRYEA